MPVRTVRTRHARHPLGRRVTRRGFALLAVLWIILGMSVLAIATSGAGWHAVAAAQHAHDRIVGRWIDEGCVERLRAVLDGALAGAKSQAATVWRDADRLLLQDSAVVLTGCDLSMRPTGRVVWSRASEAQLDALPGMSFEAVMKTLRLRAAGGTIADILTVEGSLSPEAKALFDAHFQELSRLATVDPDAWEVRVRAHVGDPPTPVNVVVRLVRAGPRAAVVRWVEW